MASLLKILRKPPQTLKSLASLANPLLHPNPSPNPNYPSPPPPPPAAAAASAHRSLPIFPTFPHCILSAPILPPHAELVCEESGDVTVWADSVKKKRKRKMNKHKLQKLRKSLRRKTKN